MCDCNHVPVKICMKLEDPQETFKIFQEKTKKENCFIRLFKYINKVGDK